MTATRTDPYGEDVGTGKLACTSNCNADDDFDCAADTLTSAPTPT